MGNIKIIDLHFQDAEQSIGSFIIESTEGPVLVETGPESTFEKLEEGIENSGYHVKDIKHVLLTHIHFDHAGAAWKFAKHGAKIYVHPIGLPHLASPEKLWNSAAQIYGDDMDRLWGKMEPIPEEQLVAVEDGSHIHIGDIDIEAIYTPGHAVHHNAYQIGSVIFTGDVAGVKIGNGPVVPPCPPPDINISLWKESINKLKARNPSTLILTHFGKQNPDEIFDTLEIMLDDWANWMKPFFEAGTSPEEITPQFMAYTKKQLQQNGLNDREIETYEYANPSWMSVSGLLRYWKLKSQGRI